MYVEAITSNKRSLSTKVLLEAVGSLPVKALLTTGPVINLSEGARIGMRKARNSSDEGTFSRANVHEIGGGLRPDKVVGQ
jgi:hypothetical protein